MATEQLPIEYISYNGLGRSPTIWGIPYMGGLMVVSVSLFGGLIIGTFVGGPGWLVSLIAIPILFFLKMLCANDDQAGRILLLETKWVLIRRISGNAPFHGGTLAIAPTKYGRRLKDVKRYFEATVRR